MPFRPLVLAALIALGAGAAPAQNLFAPAAQVDNATVTNFEVGQRQRMLGVLGAPNTSRQAALDELIDERLQVAEARRRGLSNDPGEVTSAISSYAARADLTSDAFLARLSQAGVERETLEDFLEAGLLWRKVVGQEVGSGSVFVSDSAVERAASAPPTPELRFLLSEIILPANTPQNAARSRQILPQLLRISSFSAFEQAARQYSASPSRENGGRIDWLPAENLPGPIRQTIGNLAPGQVSQPFELPNAIAVFQLRQIGETGGRGAVTSLDYARLALPGGNTPEALAQARRIDAGADSCDDLYTQGFTANDVERRSGPPSSVPQDVALELARLDPGEIATSLGADGQSLQLIMLCSRSYRPADAEDPDLDNLRGQLQNEQAARRGDALLAELRANASIDIR